MEYQARGILGMQLLGPPQTWRYEVSLRSFAAAPRSRRAATEDVAALPMSHLQV